MDKTQLEKFEVRINKKDINKFRCSICKNHLSVPPIFVIPSVGSICGRRSCIKFSETEGAARQTVYETLAESLKFPCCNEENGCDQTLSWNEIGKHEEECEFGYLSCPFSHEKFINSEEKTCEWKGNLSEFLEHMKEHHPNSEFKNCLTMDLKDPVKNNQVYFSAVNDDIVIILALVDSHSVSHWRVWAGLNIIHDLTYRFALYSEKRDRLMTSKMKVAQPIHPAFFKSGVDDRWFNFNFGSSRNSFESMGSLAIDLFLGDFPVALPPIMLPSKIPILKYILCWNCDELIDIPFVCSKNEKHIYCQKCKSCQSLCRSCISYFLKRDTSFVYSNFAVGGSLKKCPLCYEETDYLLSHVRENHEDSSIKLGKFYSDFASKKCFFFYDDHLFILSTELDQNNLSFSLKCLESYYFKYKYELTLNCSKSSFSGVTFRGYCIPELVYQVTENSKITNNKTIVPTDLLSHFSSNLKTIEFKMIITPI